MIFDSLFGSLLLLLALAALVWRFGLVIRRLWQTAEVRGLLLTTAVTLLAGMFIFRALEGWSYLDALYFSLITLTTVGYGDLSPVTPLGKLVTMLYILLGLGILSSFVLSIAQVMTAMGAGRRGSRAAETASAKTMNQDNQAISSWAWGESYYAGDWSLLDLPAAAAVAGFTAIECNDFMLPPPPWSRIRRPLLALLPGVPPELWRYSRTTLRQLRANAQTARTTIIAWTINSDFAAPARHWPAQQLYLWRGLSAARLLAAPLLRVNLGGRPETPRRQDERIARRLAHFVRAGQRLYPDLTITVENHWGVSTDIDRHLQIFDTAVAQLPPALRARFGCCFDPVNMAVSAERPRWWRALAARANHYHLKRAALDDHGREQPLPQAELWAILREAGYNGRVTQEFPVSPSNS